MHSQSRKWIAPERIQQEKLRRYNFAREKLCKDSYAWPLSYDVDKHKKAYLEDLRKQWEKTAERNLKEKNERKRLSLAEHPETEIKPAFGGKKFGTNRSTVLGFETVFTPEFDVDRKEKDLGEDGNIVRIDKPVAEWPCREEQKYEGDERIATDALHRRFLGVPRVPGNNTVNWMQRSFIDQYPLDNFYYPPPTEEDVIWRTTLVNEMEIDDATGRELIGNELMDMIDE